MLQAGNGQTRAHPARHAQSDNLLTLAQASGWSRACMIKRHAVMLLIAQDAVLGPCVPGRDPLGDALAAFAGAPGGPTALPWQAGLLYSTGGADPSPGEGASCAEEPAFPQPQALGAALLGAQLRLLGALLAAVSPANQVLTRCWHLFACR